ncbi:4-hydroxy-tetrahydrodipicolinate synthase [Candidatus Vidania fulgoroideorum]
MIKIKGIITSLITPFKKNNKVDYFSLKKIIKFQIKSGIKNILLLGSTGEFYSLCLKEKIKIIEFSKKQIGKKANIIVGSCYSSTKKSIIFNKLVEKKGIKTIMQSVPSYIIPSQKGIIKHFEKISENTNLSIIVYDIKKRNGISLKLNTLNKIIKIKNIIGIKKSSYNINDYFSFCEILKKSKKYFYCGDDNMSLFSYLIGSKGCISVISNYIPIIFNKIYKNIKIFNNKNLNIFNNILKIINICNKEPNPVILKQIMNKEGLIKKYLRKPLICSNNKNLIHFYNEFKIY